MWPVWAVSFPSSLKRWAVPPASPATLWTCCPVILRPPVGQYHTQSPNTHTQWLKLDILHRYTEHVVRLIVKKKRLRELLIPSVVGCACPHWSWVLPFGEWVQVFVVVALHGLKTNFYMIFQFSHSKKLHWNVSCSSCWVSGVHLFLELTPRSYYMSRDPLTVPRQIGYDQSESLQYLFVLHNV